MDRSTRIAKKALIRERIRRKWERMIERGTVRTFGIFPREYTEVEAKQWLRLSLKNEGKPSRASYQCGDSFCEICQEDLLFQEIRERERLKFDVIDFLREEAG
jgi:hypothetical protein